MLKKIENEPKNARYYDKPLSLEVEQILTRSLPKKLGDPGEFCIMVTMSNGEKVKALIDLGAACNIIPGSMCSKVGNFNMRFDQYKLVMADGSIKEATCILEDVLVRVDELIIPIDFLVVNLEDNEQV